MRELSNTCEELYKLFGRPKDGNTGCNISVNGDIIKDNTKTGYFLTGAFNHKLVNPKGETVAFLSTEIVPRFTVEGKRTNYSIDGSIIQRIIYNLKI